MARKVLSFAATAVAFAARFPQAGTIDSISASGDEGRLDNVQAAMKSYSSGSGKLQWIKATEHFYAAGELVKAGDYVEVLESDALAIVNSGRAAMSSAEEAAKAETK